MAWKIFHNGTQVRYLSHSPISDQLGSPCGVSVERRGYPAEAIAGPYPTEWQDEKGNTIYRGNQIGDAWEYAGRKLAKYTIKYQDWSKFLMIAPLKREYVGKLEDVISEAIIDGKAVDYFPVVFYFIEEGLLEAPISYDAFGLQPYNAIKKFLELSGRQCDLHVTPSGVLKIIQIGFGEPGPVSIFDPNDECKKHYNFRHTRDWYFASVIEVYGRHGELANKDPLMQAQNSFSEKREHIADGVTIHYPTITTADELISVEVTSVAVIGCNVSGPTISGIFHPYDDFAYKFPSEFYQWRKPGYSYHANTVFPIDIGKFDIKATYQIDNVKSSTRAGFYLFSYVALKTYTITIKCNNDLLYSFTSAIAFDPFEVSPVATSLIGTVALTDFVGQSAQVDIEIVSEDSDTSGWASIQGFVPDVSCCSLERVGGNGTFNDPSFNPIIPNDSGNCDGDGTDAKTVSLYDTGNSVVLSDGSTVIAQRFGDSETTFNAYNHAIRKIDGTTGIITTIAGLQANLYSTPYNGLPFYRPNFGEAAFGQAVRATSLTKDTSDNIYFLDDFGLYIARINPAGIITIVFDVLELYESWDSDFRRPLGATIIFINGYLYYTDPGACVVYRISLSGTATLIAGQPPTGHSEAYTINNSNPMEGSTANLSTIRYPKCTTEDAAGNVYILTHADIKKISGGLITTFAGGSPFNETDEITLTQKIHLYGDKQDITIGEGDPNRPDNTVYQTYIFSDDSGNLYFSDCVQPVVRRLNIDTGLVYPYLGQLNTVAGSGGIFTPAQSPISLGATPLLIQPNYWPIALIGAPFHFDNLTNLKNFSAIGSHDNVFRFPNDPFYFVVYKMFCE